ncbi:uncharacterized protein TNCV_4649991 [Trichonephila clavipes]|nr:uncharacterized protein TNCV_4649991 [Trichonephila clavipes]
MTSAVLADPTRALQGTNRGSGLVMEESENDVGSLEQLLLYADEHYPAGKLPLGDHLGKVIHGVEEYHQRNVGPLRLHATQSGPAIIGYAPRPLHQLCRQCDVEQRGGNCTAHQGASPPVHALHHCRRSCRCSGVKGSARKGCLDLGFASAQGVWELFVQQLLRLRLLVSLNESLWGPQVLAAGSFHPLSSWSSWSLQIRFSARGYPLELCSLLPTISNGTLRTIHLASNTARRPNCSFHPDDQASVKLA